MAAKIAAEDGSYDKSVPDSGDGQSKAKFGNPITKPTYSGPRPEQSIEKPKRSGGAADEKSYSIP